MAGLLRRTLRSTASSLTSPTGPLAPQSCLPSSNLLARLLHKQEPEAEQEVYAGILTAQIKLVKAFSLSTSMIGLACQPVLLSYSSHVHAAAILGAGAFLSFFTFATPMLIHSISKKYVTKLYYNQVIQKYPMTFVFSSSLWSFLVNFDNLSHSG